MRKRLLLLKNGSDIKVDKELKFEKFYHLAAQYQRMVDKVGGFEQQF